MSLPIVFRSEARTEFDQAVDWYEPQRPRLGDDFLARVPDVLDVLSSMPEAHPRVFGDIRRAVVPRFPYSIL